jgi:hypothetical protein
LSQTISPPVEDSNNERSSSIDSQEPSDDAFHSIPHHVAEEEGNVATGSDRKMLLLLLRRCQKWKEPKESRLQEHKEGFPTLTTEYVIFFTGYITSLLTSVSSFQAVLTSFLTFLEGSRSLSN